MKRRTFIKSSAACAASALLAPAAEAAETRAGVSGITGYGYRLPKIKKGATLLFQGDSITDMKWGRKQSDRNHYLGHSYVYLIAARLHTDMPEAKLNFLTRGVSGNTVANLRARWKTDALDLKPDVLSILIGVNDVSRAVRSKKDIAVEAFEADYRWLLDKSRELNPDLKIVMLEPFLLPVTRVKAAWAEWRGRIDRLRRKSAAGPEDTACAAGQGEGEVTNSPCGHWQFLHGSVRCATYLPPPSYQGRLGVPVHPGYPREHDGHRGRLPPPNACGHGAFTSKQYRLSS
jgi:lysophospholipase L1-like esterase